MPTSPRCSECGAPVPGSTAQPGGCLCEDCWDAIISAQLVDIAGDDGRTEFNPDVLE